MIKLNTLVARIFKARYFPHSSFLEALLQKSFLEANLGNKSKLYMEKFMEDVDGGLEMEAKLR
jgi:hypothetical protein